jgi:hypothetical protein
MEDIIEAADMENIICMQQRHSGYYWIYRYSLLHIARLLLSTDEDWKGETPDQSDKARSFYEHNCLS